MSDTTVRPPCPNAACPQPTVIRNGSHHGRARYHCHGCGRYFGATEGTPMYHLHTPPAEGAQALLVVMRRGSLRAAEEITGHTYEAISVWLQRVARHAEAWTNVLIHDLHLTAVEIDEFWSFVRKKNSEPDNLNAGERWGSLVQDRNSRFIVAHSSGHIGADLIAATMATEAERTQHESFAWCSDGWQGYHQILTNQYRRPLPTGQRGRPRRVMPADVQLTQTITHRDVRGHLRSVETQAALGDLIAAPGTIHLERFNGCLRDRIAALTRKTHAFAKQAATGGALLHLQIFDHNWLRPHRALRLPLRLSPPRYTQRSPAMALSLTDHIWSWQEFLTSPLPCHP